MRSAWWDGDFPVTQPATGTHDGQSYWAIDIGIPCGTALKAPADINIAEVKDTGASGGYGNLIIAQIDPSHRVWLGHNKAVFVQGGANVKAGTHLSDTNSTGYSTGCHLHFEVRKAPYGFGKDSIDPTPFLGSGGLTGYSASGDSSGSGSSSGSGNPVADAMGAVMGPIEQKLADAVSAEVSMLMAQAEVGGGLVILLIGLLIGILSTGIGQAAAGVAVDAVPELAVAHALLSGRKPKLGRKAGKKATVQARPTDADGQEATPAPEQPRQIGQVGSVDPNTGKRSVQLTRAQARDFASAMAMGHPANDATVAMVQRGGPLEPPARVARRGKRPPIRDRRK